MADPVASARIGYRSLYLGLSALLIFLGLLPLSTLPPDWPGPDLVLCLTIAWVLRRPDYAPALSLVAVFLVSDLFAMRPPGLWALIVLIGTEFLRSREALTRDLPFALEWAMVGAVIAAMALANWLILALFMVPQIALGPVVMQLLSTLFAYPAVVALSHVFLGLRKVAPGAVDALGHRL